MKKLCLWLFAILVFASLGLAQASKAEKDYVNTTLFPATALLYSQGSSGEMTMRCTATAIAEDASSYTFVTAAHCACIDAPDKHIVTPEKGVFFYISPDRVGDKIYLKATPRGCGYRTKGDDFAEFTVNKTVPFPVIPLGTDPVLMDSIINIGSPLGLGRQAFFGTISNPRVDRPIVEGDIEWSGAVLVQIFGINGGSSGSAMVCVDQRKICGFIVGDIGGSSVVAMPVSRLIKFQELLAAGKYAWWRSDPDSAPVSEKTVSEKPPVTK
jgi:hypothetical protein